MKLTNLVHWMKRGIALLVWSGVSAFLGFGLYGFYLSTSLSLPKSEDHPPLLIYGAPFLLKPDQDIDAVRLVERLHRLGYRPASSEVLAPGEYRVTEQTLDIHLHEQPDTHAPALPIRLTLDGRRVVEILSLVDGGPIFPVSLEPQLISGVRGESRQVREWLPLASIPKPVIDTVLAVEDHRFYSHPGIDPVAVGRAVWANLVKGEVVQGGSTITQQLAKNLFYTPQRTFVRKIKESIAALVLEAKYRKDEILESYLNEIYLGQAGSVAIYGVGEAAHRYFGKSVHDLTIEETALIAGMIKGPNTYSPVRDLRLAKQRRDVVLRRLREAGRITEEQWKVAVNTPVRVSPPQDSLADAPYFVDYVLRQSEETADAALPDGTRVYTTLDPILQRIAGEVLQNGLARLEKVHPKLKRADLPLQGALVALDPRTGGILAMVGGREYRASQFNRSVQAKRQPGSLFKPLVYLAAFETTKDAGPSAVTPASLILDAPVTFESPAGPWSPQNYDRQFHGTVTIRAALEQSLNVPAVRVAQTVGAKRIIRTAHDLGIKSPLDDNLSLALGSSAVSLLEITAAFGVLAHNGLAAPPSAIRSVAAPNGDPLWHALPDRRQAVSPQAAYVVTSLLKGVLDRGTAARARAMGLQSVVAGKTGTTDGYRDAWFVGYTPDIVIGVWVGFDDEQPLGLTGAQAALPIWTEFARQVIPSNSPDFTAPSGVVTREIDPQTGQLATSKCPERTPEVFIEGTEPTVYCEVHGEGFWDRIKRTFSFF
ncbi:MAG: PBP1A family penicillin-binding protein [Nitrospirota bacterium]